GRRGRAGRGGGGVDGLGAATADRAEPGGACRLSLLRALGAAAPHRGELRTAGHQPRKLAPACPRYRRPFDRDVERLLLVPPAGFGLAATPARRPDRGGPDPPSRPPPSSLPPAAVLPRTFPVLPPPHASV